MRHLVLLLLIVLWTIALAQPPGAGFESVDVNFKVEDFTSRFGASLPPDVPEQCSRALSGVVRNAVGILLAEAVRDYAYQLPEDCVLSPARDMFWKQNTMKDWQRHGIWRCKACDKQFNSERNMERHLNNRHSDHLLQNGVCLAEYCPMFRLNCTEPDEDPKDLFPLNRMPQFQTAPCNSERMQSLKHQCKITMRKCFPGALPDKLHELHTMFSHQVCDRLTCGWRPESSSFVGVYQSRKWPWYYIAAIVLVGGLVAVVAVALMITLCAPTVKTDPFGRKSSRWFGRSQKSKLW
eukprot:TRINITY_DN1250_c1_g1_i1.p1 TRINITY_DN1250_c1_g1~~TRINITY_DN1250_c1_g1_i1.p1  ORF type:complete len:294 (-),score=42.67 TRINITY_DN1250_c1_g1_i1:153-1034(-)